MTIVGTINVLNRDITVRVSETKIDDFGIKTIKTSGTSSIVKQVLNHFREEGIIKFDKVWVSSENFSGGNAVRVYTLNSDEKSKRIIRNICTEFEFGSFNPMIDLYEYKGNELEFKPNGQYDDGTSDSEYYPMKSSVKFVTYSNKPPYGTREYYTIFPPVDELLKDLTIMKEVA
mgnify:CR=1 FL=1